ncbi:MAG TPA: hypothetical protein VGV39_13525 [Mesorhizobium sp.]|jgi:hypothetical protein|uniref:hypothetical protein n=1 Tax=Mesorhizobium sp. TaxID=1871066 RepID=UPI002DDDB04B|nr:hypothetical protein [Mesorhizobium sp.]HEV2504092.1 hypothetical protein [Mesorhizobium sp.]
MLSAFATRSVSLQSMLQVTFQAPTEDVDRIMADVTAIIPLVMGKYDSNSYQSAEGTERYRPLPGAAAGPETELRKRPGVVEVFFEIPEDQQLLGKVVEAIFQAHSYQEPVIRIQSILSSRSKGMDDSKNPNRWWNTTGDWKKNAELVQSGSAS